MGSRLVGVLCVVILSAVSESWADEPGGDGAAAPPASRGVAGSAVSPAGTIRPWVHRAMADDVRSNLEAGFKLAVERVHEVEACRDLFARLGADGLEMLATGLYFPVDSYRREVEVCGRNTRANSRGAENLAYTTVGGAPTFICRHFARVSTETAAMALIHEALHHAGLAERPHDRLAMSSTEITEIVRESCGF
jgi:hypothetical protein